MGEPLRLNQSPRAYRRMAFSRAIRAIDRFFWIAVLCPLRFGRDPFLFVSIHFIEIN